MSVHEIKVMPPEPPKPPVAIITPPPVPAATPGPVPLPEWPRVAVSEAEEAGAVAWLQLTRHDPHYAPARQVIESTVRIRRQQGNPFTQPSYARRLRLALWRFFAPRKD